MPLPVRVTFRDIEHTEAVEAKVRQRAAKFEKFADRATALNVVIAAPHARSHGPSHKGKLYHITLELVLPGGEVVVHKGEDGNHAHEDVYVAIRDAFEALERRALDHFGKMADH